MIGGLETRGEGVDRALSGRNGVIPNGQKIDTRGSGVPPVFEW